VIGLARTAADPLSVAGLVGRALLVLALLGATAWGALALLYSVPADAPVGALLAGVFSLAGVASAFAVGARWRTWAVLSGFCALFLSLLGWWSRIEPSNERDWQPDVARLAYAEIDGERVTVRNVRNFSYRSETDYTPGYYDRTYDLAKLRSVDLIAVYWMGPAIAHTMLSFGFEGGEQLAISIETRKERGEDYSTTRGFFKQYELYYVVADERDVVRLRTNYRQNPPEDVHVYRLHGSIENGRRVFLQYMQRINALKARPEFYNTLIDNCTTGIWMNARINPGHVPLSWKVFASGYLPEYLHGVGMLAPGVPFAELQRLGHVNARAQAADGEADFSRLIRIGVPGPEDAGKRTAAAQFVID
jgi:hypothetical protein